MSSSSAEIPARRRQRSRPSRATAIRITEVAAMAGVSTATVSRTLAAPDTVKAETRDRVLAAVRATGYTPNLAARSLRAQRSGLALVIVPNLITPFFADLLLGVDQALSEHGYGLLIGNLHDRPEKQERLIDLVFAGGADGIIILDGRILGRPGRSLADSGVPLVAVSVPTTTDAAQVLVREREGGAAVAEHLLGLGHRRFGYVTGPPHSHIEHERWAGFSGALARSGIGPEAVWRRVGNFHLETGIEAAHALLATPRGAWPTAIFAVSDMMAIGLITTLRPAGVLVPRDLSVVGFDGIAFADLTEPVLTTVRQPREEMGRAAAGFLMRLAAGETIPASERVLRLDCSLRIAASTAAPPI
jgi:LacI family repressor for deo operon, udp, cdd, tsx, nupC, and nupG